MALVNTYNFILSSDCRTSGSNENPIYNLFYNISTQSKKNYFNIRILNPVVPFSFDIITPTNNQVNNCILNVNGVVSYFSFSVTTGNYTIDELTLSIQNYLNTAYKTAYPSGNSKFVVSQTAGYEGSVSCSVVLGSGDVGVSLIIPKCFVFNMLGYPDMFIITNNSPAVGSNHYNMAPITQLYIRSNQLLTRNYEFTAGKTTQTPSNIMAILNLTTGFDTYLINSTLVQLTSRLLIQSIYEMDFYLTCSNPDITINLRGVPWSFNLEITEIAGGETVLTDRERERYDNITKSRLDKLKPSDVGIDSLRVSRQLKLSTDGLVSEEVVENIEDRDNPMNKNLSDEEIQKYVEKLDEYSAKLDMLTKNAEEIGADISVKDMTVNPDKVLEAIEADDFQSEETEKVIENETS